MPFIKATDSNGKTHWLQENGYWGERVSAKHFSPLEAHHHAQEITRRNRYIDESERFIPEIHHVKA